jgi:nucleotide-binding universal stress UspA family protein
MGPLTTVAAFDALQAAAHTTVEELARSLGPSLEMPVTHSVGHGGAASLLLDAAHSSSLLIVGSRGRGGFARLLLGSTSTQCATHSTAPVVVIPAAAPIGHLAVIVVAFDGSANSIAALQWANEFAAPGSVIECVSVWDTTPIAVGADQFFFPEASALAEERFEHLAMQTIRPARRGDVEVRYSFVEGQPRRILAERAASSDLLVVGARGHGAIGIALLGSVSTWLLHQALGPVVVVPHRTGDPDVLDSAHAERED